jgi:hypothetical protein
MYRLAKNPEIPSSTPDKITFPFQFNTFTFTFDNYVKSFTRNRVSKEKVNEIIEEINNTIQHDGDGFNSWDVFGLILFCLLALTALFCIFTLRLNDLTMWLIKFLGILLCLVADVCIWGYCQSGTIAKLRNKVQFVLESQDDFYEEKGMKWTLTNEHDFPYWIELHVQSEFEMKDDHKEQVKLKKAKKAETLKYSEKRGMLDTTHDDEDYDDEGGYSNRRKQNRGRELEMEDDEDDDDRRGSRGGRNRVEQEDVDLTTIKKGVEIKVEKQAEPVQNNRGNQDDEDPDEASYRPSETQDSDDDDQRSV